MSRPVKPYRWRCVYRDCAAFDYATDQDAAVADFETHWAKSHTDRLTEENR